jgi:hypothetical protein
MPNVVSSFINIKLRPERLTILSKMIDSGKELYFKDVLLPDYSDADKMGYTKEQLEWCIENESYMWRYLEKKCFTVMIS